jgi:hypothetical protein
MSVSPSMKVPSSCRVLMLKGFCAMADFGNRCHMNEVMPSGFAISSAAPCSASARILACNAVVLHDCGGSSARHAPYSQFDIYLVVCVPTRVSKQCRNVIDFIASRIVKVWSYFRSKMGCHATSGRSSSNESSKLMRPRSTT